jgi:DNA (cytosine-5)-methyltransferase 1
MLQAFIIRKLSELYETMKTIKVVELFAGVGGFRLGLEAASNTKKQFEIVWSSQWEPNNIVQHASEIYIRKFGVHNHSCEDIQEVIAKDFKQIPNHDLLVGGFPCQDYSIARVTSSPKGIYGTKGVLWWSIYAILKKKGKHAPRFLLLENVDRLLKSPSTQRGRDFAIMLASLSDLGYIVEWRVINAAEYGFPQRRKRVFLMGYRKGSAVYTAIQKQKPIEKWLLQTGIIAKAFPVKNEKLSSAEFSLTGNLEKISKSFGCDKAIKSPFENTGIMINRRVCTMKTNPVFNEKYTVLKDIIINDETKIPSSFFIKEEDIQKWQYIKGAKTILRKSKDGFEYTYKEGAISFPDCLEKASRTIITGEGGISPSRFKHVVKTKSGRLRRLLPIELERLNGFSDNHTKYLSDGVVTSDVRRAFIMGNALVVGVVEKLGKGLLEVKK